MTYVTKDLVKQVTSKHMLIVFIKNLKNHKCDLCDKSFSQKKILKKDINSIHERLTNLKCDLCDKAFCQTRYLKKHIDSVHKGQKIHKCDLCDLCDKAFSDPYTLKKHPNNVHLLHKNYLPKYNQVFILFSKKSSIDF